MLTASEILTTFFLPNLLCFEGIFQPRTGKQISKGLSYFDLGVFKLLVVLKCWLILCFGHSITIVILSLIVCFWWVCQTNMMSAFSITRTRRISQRQCCLARGPNVITSSRRLFQMQQSASLDHPDSNKRKSRY